MKMAAFVFSSKITMFASTPIFRMPAEGTGAASAGDADMVSVHL